MLCPPFNKDYLLLHNEEEDPSLSISDVSITGALYEDKPILENKSLKPLQWPSLLPGLCIYMMTYFFSTLSNTYLPLEIHDRDMGSDVTGTILGSYMWAAAGACLVAPYFYSLKRIKLLLVCSAGVFLLTSCAFSAIFLLPPQYMQYAALGIRIVQGVSGGLFENFFWSALLTVHSERVGTVSGMIEVACDIGTLMAPIIGAFLYEEFGFVTTQLIPCVVLAIMLLWMTQAPDFGTEIVPSAEEEAQGFSKIFTCFPLMFLMFLPFSTMAIMTLPMSFMAPFVRQTYNLSARYTGYIFMVIGLAYSVTCPLIGYLSDMPGFNPFTAILLCPIILLLSQGTMFASHLLTIPLNYPQILVAYAGVGFGCGIGNGPVLVAIFKAWTYNNVGLRDHSAFITSFFLLCYPLGMAAGTSLGGILKENMSFMTIIQGQVMFLAVYSILMIVFTLTYGRRIQQQGE